MSIKVISASSQLLLNSSPAVTTYPFTAGAWVNFPAGGAGGAVFSLDDGAAGANLMCIRNNGGTLVFRTAGEETNFGTAQDDKWVFVLGRWISSTNRRATSLRADGTITHTAQTTGTAQSGMTELKIGRCLNIFFALDALVAEFWYSDVDVQDGGEQLSETLLKRLAFSGPFSVPHIKKDIIEYRSFKEDPLTGKRRDVYFGKKGIQRWTNVNGVTIGAHVPLSRTYKKPVAGEKKIFAVTSQAPASEGVGSASGAADVTGISAATYAFPFQSDGTAEVLGVSTYTEETSTGSMAKKSGGFLVNVGIMMGR